MKTRKTKYTCPSCGWSDGLGPKIGIRARPLSVSEIRQCYKLHRKPKGFLERLSALLARL